MASKMTMRQEIQVVTFWVCFLLYFTPIVLFAYALWHSNHFVDGNEFDLAIAWFVGNQGGGIGYPFRIFGALVCICIPTFIKNSQKNTIIFVGAIVLVLLVLSIYFGSYLQKSDIEQDFQTADVFALDPNLSLAEHDSRVLNILGQLRGYIWQVQQTLMVIGAMITGTKMME